jgi:hypothetical protein
VPGGLRSAARTDGAGDARPRCLSTTFSGS